MQVSKFQITCPPWALPREKIPIHVKIDKTITSNIKKVVVDLPDCFELIDTINLIDYDVHDNEIIIKNIGKATKSEFDYFGIIIASKEPFRELKKQIAIKIKFVYNDGTSEKCTTFARIFRPLLEIEKAPDNIILSNESIHKPKLPFSLKFTGFGEIHLRSECEIGGQIVSHGTSVLDEVLQRVLKEGLLTDDPENKGVQINEDYITNLSYQLKNDFLKDEDIQRMLKIGQIDEDTACTLYELNKEKQEKLMKIMYKTVEGYLIKIISDILKRNVSNNLQLESETKINTIIKVSTTDVTIRFFYKDLIGNIYQPIEQKIQIINKCENSAGFDVEIPLVITKVDESDAYKKVGAMRIGTHP